MSLRYGLNVKKSAPRPVRRPAFDDDDEEEEEVSSKKDDVVEESIRSVGGLSKPKGGIPGHPKPGAPPSRRKEAESRENISSATAAQAKVKEAQEVDASIFDYDSFHDAKTTVSETKKAAARQDAVERKPKYINNLLDAAARRKQDQQIAKEKLLQKEREAEGDEFADKEKFVTGAYKAQQEETKRLEEEEKKKSEEEERRKRMGGGGMQGFYKTMMDQSERQHQEAVEAAAKIEKDGATEGAGEGKAKTDAELAAEAKAKGVNVHLNDEGQLVDKRELLTAGLNVTSSSKSGEQRSADHLRTSNRPAQPALQKRDAGSQQAQRERQSRMVEEQLAAQAKRKREEEEEEQAKLAKAAKSQKTEKDVGDAKARYLARKAAKERGVG